MQSKAERLLEGVRAGEEKTAFEWGELFYPDKEPTVAANCVRSIMRGLRRKGHMVFSVRKDRKEPGIVKDVSRNETEFLHVYNRFVNESAEPCLVNSFRYAERLIQEHPQLRKVAIQEAKNLIRVAAQTSNELLGIEYEPSKSLPASRRR